MGPLSSLSRSIAGKTAVITGAASGMGRATALLFAEEGADVALVDIDQATVDAVVAEIDGAGRRGAAAGWACDVSDPATVAETVASVAARFGGIDILVNNAGVSLGTPIDTEPWSEAWERTIAVNLTGQALMAHACVPHLLASGAGRIVNIASTEGVGATGGISPYTASKHGVIGLTRSLAVELGRRGVTVNCVCPGPVRTAMTAPIPDEHKDRFARRRVPLGRYGDPEEVAHMTLSLVLPAASFVNGAVLVVDGGLTVQNT